MSNLQQVEEAIRYLSPEDLAQFRDWFSHFDAEIWDRKLEQDVEAGRLDALADEALRDLYGEWGPLLVDNPEPIPGGGPWAVT